MKTLSKVNGTIGKVINDNLQTINAATTKDSLVECICEILKTSNNPDKFSFIQTLNNCDSLTGARMYVYNYLLAGDGYRAV